MMTRSRLALAAADEILHYRANGHTRNFYARRLEMALRELEDPACAAPAGGLRAPDSGKLSLRAGGAVAPGKTV